MIQKSIFRFLLLCLSFNVVALKAQNDSTYMMPPFDFPLLLSGNFGELRTNHFHAGIDFKTQGVSGKPIYSPCDGYVSRVTVGAGGYGRAIYVVHDNGYMTVYGHLDRFLPIIADTVRVRQYADETYAVDIEFPKEKFPVKRGELLAYAGNSGYSFGPHLHFEVRSACGNELVNPLFFYKNLLDDTKPPKAYSVMITPYPGAGTVNGACESVTESIAGGLARDTVRAWGNIGFSVKAEDFMDNTNNRYGVYTIELLVDDSLRFSSCMDSYALSETRSINAWAEYKKLYDTGEWFLRSYILDHNMLPFMTADENRGWLNVNEERIYNVEFRLGDYHGNVSRYKFSVMGVCDTIPVIPDDGTYYLYWFVNNEISLRGMNLSIPAGELFENACIKVVEENVQGAVSPRYDFGGRYPLKNKARLSLRVYDTVFVDTAKYYMKRITRKGAVPVGGTYENGRLVTDIRLLGCYEAAVDTVPPVVKAVGEKYWRRNGRLLFSLLDKESGIKSYKALLDGVFILFEYNAMRGRLSCNLKSEGVERGKHRLLLTVEDNVGNVTTVECDIIY